MNLDSKKNAYLNVNNIRVTYVRSETRRDDANWSESDVIRIQAYKGLEQTGGLHRGAEMPVNGTEDLIDLAMALLELSRHHRTGQTS